MKKERTNEDDETVDTVHTHTHTHKDNLQDEKIKKLKTEVSVFALIAFILVVILISNIVSTRKSLSKIIYNAKIEAENTLASTGRMMYTEDVEKLVKESSTYTLSDENLPENTTENQQELGTIVAPKENWNIETVTAVSVGSGETVPVPIGFYYVGGNLNTGVIISDNEADKYDGITDKTTYEYNTQLKGNQFVWIPCKEEEYVKCEVWNGTTQTSSALANTGWDKTTYTAELPQIRKYEGFYVARYEAGLSNSISEFTSTQKNTDSNQVYNKEGIPQAKAGVIPWNFIDWTTSQKNAKNMYNTSSVSSGLITGTQWDVMINKMLEKGAIEISDLTNSGNWGNHINSSIEYNGRLARAWHSGGWYLEAFGGKTEGKTSSYSSNNGDLLTTGASRQTEKYHIYDVAGNLWELTDEVSTYKGTNAQYRVARGGSYIDSYATYPACYRIGTTLISYCESHVGFRVVLYIK